MGYRLFKAVDGRIVKAIAVNPLFLAGQVSRLMVARQSVCQQCGAIQSQPRDYRQYTKSQNHRLLQN